MTTCLHGYARGRLAAADGGRWPQRGQPSPVKPGWAVIFWQRPTLAGPVVRLPLALRRFTSVFGMGTGGSTALWSPEAGRALVHREDGRSGLAMGALGRGGLETDDGKERQRGPAERGVCMGGDGHGDRFTGNCIWGVGKRWGVLRLFTIPWLGLLAQVGRWRR